MVDPSLLRQAADRGVTICFADLDGADGLWVPEERTVLVSRRLTEAQVAEVIEHELTHVAIDDQHADLDAGRDVLLGHPPVADRPRLLPALLTGAALIAVVGGVGLGLAKATDGRVKQEQVVAPTVAGRTASGGAVLPQTTVVPSRMPDGRVVFVTVVVTRTPGVPGAATTSAGTLAPTPSPTATPPARTSAPAAPAPTPSATVPEQPSLTSNPAVGITTTPAPATSDPAASSPAASGGVDPGDDGGGQGDDAGVGTGDAATDAASAPVLAPTG